MGDPRLGPMTTNYLPISVKRHLVFFLILWEKFKMALSDNWKVIKEVVI